MTFREMTPERLARVRAMRGLLLSTERDDLFAHIDALTDRAEAAERERDDARAAFRRLFEAAIVWHAAERKLAALVEAIDAAGHVVTGDGGPTRAQLVEMLRKARNVDIVELVAYVDALRAARGEP